MCLFEYSMPVFSLSCVRKLIVLVTILFLAVAFALFTYQRRPLEPHRLGWSETRAKAVRPNFITEPKQLILYWGATWNLKSYLPPDGSMTKDGCGVTHERGLLLEADAVVFHFTTITQAEIPWRFPRWDALRCKFLSVIRYCWPGWPVAFSTWCDNYNIGWINVWAVAFYYNYTMSR